MAQKLFVDDKREFPKGYQCVRTYEDAVLYLKLLGDFDHVSLDYSLGGEKTGLDILRFMDENGIRPRSINIHSNNIKGIRLMERFAREHFPDSSVTVNTL